MAHYNSYDLRVVIFLPQDNCGNSRANIFQNAVTHEAANLLDQNQPAARRNFDESR